MFQPTNATNTSSSLDIITLEALAQYDQYAPYIQSSNVNPSSTPSSSVTERSHSTDSLITTPTNSRNYNLPSTSSTPDIPEFPHTEINIPANYVSQVLNASLEGKDLLKRYDSTKPLSDKDKRLLGRVIILSILSQNPNTKLGAKQFEELAKQLKVVFPGEEIHTYFRVLPKPKDQINNKQRTSPTPVDKKAQEPPPASVLGKLYDAYVTRKRVLKESKVISKRRRSAPSRSSGHSLHEDNANEDLDDANDDLDDANEGKFIPNL